MHIVIFGRIIFLTIIISLILTVIILERVPSLIPQPESASDTVSVPPSFTKEIAEPVETVSEETTQALPPIAEEKPVESPQEYEPFPDTDTADPPPPPIVEPEIVPTEPAVPFATINTVTRASLVNILCTTKSGGILNPISGSGIIIDPRGIILTNAHIAQYLLLKDYQVTDFITCTIRTGSPAKPVYTTDIFFISPAWVIDNAENIIKQTPRGTGEHDFALLYITGTVGNIMTPSTFPSLDIDIAASDVITTDDEVLIASYPAGFLGGKSIQTDLYAVSTIVTIKKLFTFSTITTDLFSVGGNIAAQQGSSGGAVVNTRNKLIGIIVTSTTAETTAERDLRAINLSHINRSLVQTEGIDLSELLARDPVVQGENFARTEAPLLTELLTIELEKLND